MRVDKLVLCLSLIILYTVCLDIWQRFANSIKLQFARRVISWVNFILSTIILSLKLIINYLPAFSRTGAAEIILNMRLKFRGLCIY